MRLIDADKIKIFAWNAWDYGTYDRDAFDAGAMYMMEKINETPTADSIVKHGHWVKRTRWKNHVCSECSFESNTAYNFCPNCGAKMGE